MRRQTNALLIQVFVEPLTAVVESFRQWICTSFFFFLPITVALCDLAFVFFFFSALLLFKPFQSNDLKDVFSLAFNFFFFFFVCMCHFTRSFPHTSRFYLRHGIFCFSFFFFLHYHRKKLAIARLPSFSSPDFIIYCHYTGIAFCSGLTTLL